ncbi:MAG: tRNA (adenosine(37)-N6)-dimethylallyltransferase MiaA [Bacteroidales bacterium]
MNQKKSPAHDLLVVTGPTASGKTTLAVSLAARLEGEIISADSRQVYRGMNIGTGKDYKDYMIAGTQIPFHLIDIADPGYKYNVFEYQRDFLKAYCDISSRGHFPVVCGGSGMYIDSIVSGYRMVEAPAFPELRASLEKKSLVELTGILSSYRKLHNVTDIDTKKRAIRAIEIEFYNQAQKEKRSEFPIMNPLIIGISLSRVKRRQNITERLKQRLADGMVDEIRQLLAQGLSAESLIYYGLEYKYITLFLTRKLSFDEMCRSLETAIHQYAKRQMTWFRGMERRGIPIHWIDGELPTDEKVILVLDLLNR